VGVLALLWLAFRALSGGPAAVHLEARSSELYAELARWSSSAAPHTVHVEGDGAWDAAARDWLAALPGAGTRVSWSGAGPLPVAIAADPVADPEGATRAAAAAPAGTRMVLADQVGPLDSIQPAGGGARFLARSAPRLLTLAAGSARAVTAVPDTLVLGRVLVIARAGWESKFVTAALEERGWTVDARLFLRPGRDVRQGPGLPLDTSRYAAVIVLDSGLAEPRAMSGYVRSGGGAILSMRAARDPGLAQLTAGTRGAEYPGLMPFDTAAPEPHRSLALTPILPRSDAVVLERSGPRVAVAARRLERGRALTFGYHDTWRWRMSGGDGAAGAHRDWWADLVSLVARTGRVPVPNDVLTDEAPRAALAARLGPQAEGPANVPGRRWPGDPLLFGVALAALFSEWLSRRLRGAV
jgi:hypothetical protein